MGKKDNENKAIEIIKNQIRYEIQQGSIPFNIDQKTIVNNIFTKINKLKYNAAETLKNLSIMKEAKIKFCQKIKLNFQKKYIEFELKKILRIYIKLKTIIFI